MLSAATNVASLPFAPTPATLDEALALLEERGPLGGGAVEPARRREALARYSVLPAPGGRPGRGWRHDYTRVAFDGLQWTSGRLALDTVPFREVAREAPDAHVDRPALATENVAGIIHRGATLLESPQGAIRGSTSSDPRIVVVPLSDAVRSHAALVARATQNAAPERRDDRFAALSTAFQNCGVFVYVPDGVVLDAPIQLLFANGGDDEAVFPHVVVVLGAGARASVLERHAGGGDPFVCGLVDALCEEGAQLEYGVVQTAGEGTRLAFWRDAQLGRDARIRWSIAELGGTLSRCVVTAGLDAPGAKAETSALFF
ncbi:MAG: SufD family Fe-S cluster assembly protein, partial [Candidatus Eremiobacteraeota bacterium]|nr:SufD family Fe-S cluster assembly protein [Candidatus Eremiobacteraeota bacterium]